MHEVKVFDGKGKLKRIISSEEVHAISDAIFFKESGFTGEKRRIKFSFYKCLECKIVFKSNSTKGAKYCPACRKNASRRSKQRKRNRDATAKLSENKI